MKQQKTKNPVIAGKRQTLPVSFNGRFRLGCMFFFFLTTALFFSVTGFARENTLLQTGWKFYLGDVTNAASADFNDSNWQAVSLPHNWGWKRAQLGEKFYRGPGWYRYELAVKRQAGKRYFLRFGAASTVADVYLNGALLGEHRGGFGAFCFEVTTNLSDSGTNLLAVRVSNAVEPDIAPLSGDFNVYGGLYRPVHLIETSEESFALTDHASPGVAWLQSKVSSKSRLPKFWNALRINSMIITCHA